MNLNSDRLHAKEKPVLRWNLNGFFLTLNNVIIC